jgi:hypothetical protein
MKIRILLLFAGFVILTLVAGGCTDILTQQKVGGFGDAQGAGAVTTVPTPGTLGASSSGSIGQMRQGSIYATCYSGCTNAKKKSVNDCDKACCMAQCQPMSPEETKRCVAICGVDLEKTTNI